MLVAELGDGFDEVDITGDDALEARYREWLPVVEIDGERAFVYFVDPAALRRRSSHKVRADGSLTAGTTPLAQCRAVSQSG